MSNKILVVDDETEIADLIEVYKKTTEKSPQWTDLGDFPCHCYAGQLSPFNISVSVRGFATRLFAH